MISPTALTIDAVDALRVLVDAGARTAWTGVSVATIADVRRWDAPRVTRAITELAGHDLTMVGATDVETRAPASVLLTDAGEEFLAAHLHRCW